MAMSETGKAAQDEMLLSVRGKQTADYKDFLFIYKQRASVDPYDAVQNPHVCLGLRGREHRRREGMGLGDKGQKGIKAVTILDYL